MAGFASYPAIIYRHVAGKRSRDVTVEKWNRLGDEVEAIQDTLGANPHVGHANVAARLGSIEGTLANIQGALINLSITNNAAATATQLDVVADLIAIEGQLVSFADVTIDATITGLNGKDAGSLAAGWWYVYLGYAPLTGSVGGLISTQDDRASITAPAGYTKWRRVGAVYYTGSTFYRFHQHDCETYYDYDAAAAYPTTHTCHSNIVASSSFVPASLIAHLPATARKAYVQAGLNVAPTGSNNRSFRAFRFGGANVGGVPLAIDAVAATSALRMNAWIPATNQQFYVQWSGAPGTNAAAAVDILGFWDPIG